MVCFVCAVEGHRASNRTGVEGYNRKGLYKVCPKLQGVLTIGLYLTQARQYEGLYVETGGA